jgi:tRNA(fMet)-specific endonuclease VapC
MTIGDQHLAISAICHAELMAGIRQRKSAKLQAAYEKTLRGRIPILAVDQRVAEFFAEIKSEVRKVGGPREDFDLLIAATAKAHGLILATLNHRHFFDIQGLAVEDWSS